MSEQTTWDVKAATYNRYTPKKDTFEQHVLHLCHNYGVIFKDKTVLDIGCGTGVYTLHLAQQAHRVDALDFSKEMLGVLEEDASSLHVNNITCIHNSWEGFTCQELYDIAFCSMSPALGKAEDFEKMHESAKQKVFLGWAGKRESTLHDAIFQACGKTYAAPRGGLDLKRWLDKHRIAHKIETLAEVRTVRKTYEAMLENVCWHLTINHVDYDMASIGKMLEERIEEDGKISNTVSSQMLLLIF